MGLCFSCSKSKDRFKAKSSKICSQIQSTSCSTCINSLLPNSAFPSSQKSEESMGTSFPNMNLTNPIKGLVSKRKKRYKKDGFDLDLTYITPKIIAMGYPASNIEGVYRNHIDDVVKFLDQKHKDHYYIYNLCSERSYDISKFHNRVQVFAFDDHNPPKIDTIGPFCRNVHTWLTKDERNVAAVHCKAGKGRTGTMICCYLLHSGSQRTADEALEFYGQTRTQDMKGVTIPSQVRYVRYYEKLLHSHQRYTPVTMYIKEFVFNPVPNFPGGQATLTYSISCQTLSEEGENLKCKKMRKNDMHDVKKGDSSCSIKLDYCLPLTGDIKVEFYIKRLGRKEKLFQFWFNTFFVNERIDVNGFAEQNGGGSEGATYTMVFEKNELDIVNKKDKQNKMFTADFKLTVLLGKRPRDDSCPSTYARESPSSAQDTPSENSDSSEDYTNEEDEWDSVLDSGQLDPRGVGYRILSECEIASQLTSSSSEQPTELLTA